ncbi:MAG: trypsin-like peptidase domain-containing protein [Candidatus Moduliflexus flocculans]|nr:trypsin-like peptidase domain-containing protein [Candidatus Moduliflexus flocculans]
MTKNSKRNVLSALVALSLALFACADTGSPGPQSPAEQSAPTELTTGPRAAAPQTAVPAPPAQTPANARLTEDERNTIEIVRKTRNSVVYITNLQYVRDFFYSSDEPVRRGSGSGFVWDDRGHIVTNFHVIDEGDKFMVSLPDQEQVEATLVGRDASKDIAVLKLSERVSGLGPVVIGTSRDLQVGQKVVAVGNPFGFDHTVTKGIVSALGRSMLGAGNVTIRDMIQTDASINPGNSGGPLLDSNGDLIGMNTMIYSPSGASSGVGFAVPVDTVKKVVPQIIQFGKVIRPDIGGVSFVRDEVARRSRIEGAIVMEVDRDSRAYATGLRGLTRDAFGRAPHPRRHHRDRRDEDQVLGRPLHRARRLQDRRHGDADGRARGEIAAGRDRARRQRLAQERSEAFRGDPPPVGETLEHDGLLRFELGQALQDGSDGRQMAGDPAPEGCPFSS